MSLHHAAQHLAAQGRGPDSTLVHMAPREVQGLQALAKAHGGSLTINPQTGLAEAGFLSNILPAVIGVGLTAATGGAAAPWMIGAGVGGLQALRTGSLSQGLMAGMGAYGGAGLASGLTSMGAESAANELANANQAAATSMGPDANARDVLMARDTTAANAAMTNAAQAPMQTGLQAAANNPGGYIDATGGGMQTAKYAAAAAAPAMGGLMAPQNTVPGTEHYTGPLSKYRMADDYSSYNPIPPNPYYQAQYKTYAGGGPVEQMSNANAIGENTGFPMADIHQGAYATPWQTPMSQNVVQGTADTGVDQVTGEENRFAGGGGISDLGGYSDGGRMLRGPGDGMSDSIPAQIGGKQPARLADGEFVVPADVVSHLGNGSTDAGAKQLYKMMDRIRQQRTGKKKQAPEVNPSKAMPA